MASPSESRMRPNVRIVLMTTAAIACAAAVVTPIAGAVAAETHLSARGPIDVRIGANADLTRIEFRSSVGQRPQIRRDGDRVIVRLPRGAESELVRLSVDPPKGVAEVHSRVDGAFLELTITLEPGASATTGQADGAVYLDLAPAKLDVAGIGARGHKPDPVPASGVVKVAATSQGQAVTLGFGWAAPVASAVFRRGAAIYAVFDGRAKLDLGPHPDRVGAAVRRIRWSNGPDYTVVRIETPEAVSAQVQTQGANWSISLGGPTEAAQDGVKITRDDQTGPPALNAALTGATRVIWITDPEIGDRIAVVTASGSPRPVLRETSLVDAVAPVTLHGLAVQAIAPDLKVEIAGDLVRISRPAGLIMSATGPAASSDAVALDTPARAAEPGLIDFQQWSRTGARGFVARYRDLQDRALSEGAQGQGAPVTARMGFARFLIGSGLNYEAIGLLDMIAQQNAAMLNDPELRGLRGAARVMVGRYKEAEADFSAPAAANDPAIALWRGYADAKLGDYASARRAFTSGARAVDKFPPVWRARFATTHAVAALELKDFPAARSLIAFACAQTIEPADQLAARLVQARLFEADGQADRALAVYDAISAASTASLATPASLNATRLKYQKGVITPAEAVATLDSLRFRWRGDSTELEVIRTLGEIYLGLGRYREALETLRSAGKRLPDSPAALRLQAELSDAFRQLFLQGGADQLEPIQALALFYDFRELTPVGAEGDDMVRRLSRRLIDVDLLPQAAELLKYQVDNRLDGVAKAQVATNLAAVYLMDRRPELALQAIWGSRTTLLPNALNAQRRVLEARALTALNKPDNALELLGKDASPEAEDVRAEIYWSRQDWTHAAATYEKRLGERFKTPATALSGEDETRLIRAGAAYSLAGDAKALQQLASRFAPFIEHARAPEALRIALAGLDGGQITPSDFARVTTQADTFAGWVATMKQRFRDSSALASQATSKAVATGG